jgi:hypothetical protein
MVPLSKAEPSALFYKKRCLGKGLQYQGEE